MQGEMEINDETRQGWRRTRGTEKSFVGIRQIVVSTTEENEQERCKGCEEKTTAETPIEGWMVMAWCDGSKLEIRGEIARLFSIERSVSLW